MKIKIKQIFHNYYQYIFLILISLILCMPLLKETFFETHDGMYHISRIISTHFSMQDGQFLPVITNQWSNGFGYSWNLFYPPLINYVGVFFKLFLPTYTKALKAVLVLLTFIASFAMYNLMFEITKNKKVSLLTSLIYVSSPYRLTDIYVRLALGEVITFSALPILFHGLYNVFYSDVKKDYLITIGTCLILLAHNISSLLTIFIVLIIC